ncbi:GntR family transcriptional regulator [Pseudonocardia sp.]|uniref:GntR family transcriptional regulator n=1 Tax=Pseudonocardia sp. TaxID=60912 RepID=UPI003D0CF683
MAAQYKRPWQKIADDLQAKIQAGRWQPGDRLPTLGQLQEQYGVAKGTIQNAINHLSDEGFVATRAGSGIYVVDREDK